jgi:hypothetical protein
MQASDTSDYVTVQICLSSQLDFGHGSVVKQIEDPNDSRAKTVGRPYADSDVRVGPRVDTFRITGTSSKSE